MRSLLLMLSDFETGAVNLEAVEVAERAEGEPLGLEVLGGDAEHVFGRDRLDARDDLLGRDAAAVDDLLAGERPGARARRFQAEQDGRDGLVFDELQLFVADGLAQGSAPRSEA